MPENEFAERIRKYYNDLKEIYRRHSNENTDYTVELKDYLDNIKSTDDLCALHYYMNRVVLPLLEDNVYDVKYFNEIGALIQYTQLVIDLRKNSNCQNKDNNCGPTKARD